MAKVHEIVATEKATKAKFYAWISEQLKVAKKSGLFEGLARTYQPNDEGGEKLAPELKTVDKNVKKMLSEVKAKMADYLNITARKDWSNLEAKGDIVVDDVTIHRNVPAPYLLFLEKQLNDLHELVENLPVLAMAESWDWDSNRGCYVTDQVTTSRMKKLPRSHTLFEPTEHQPGQAHMYHDDVPIGTYLTTKFSGAIKADEKAELLVKVEKLQRAVLKARERANAQEAHTSLTIGDDIFSYLLG